MNKFERKDIISYFITSVFIYMTCKILMEGTLDTNVWLFLFALLMGFIAQVLGGVDKIVKYTVYMIIFYALWISTSSNIFGSFYMFYIGILLGHAVYKLIFVIFDAFLTAFLKKGLVKEKRKTDK